MDDIKALLKKQTEEIRQQNREMEEEKFRKRITKIDREALEALEKRVAVLEAKVRG